MLTKSKFKDLHDELVKDFGEDLAVKFLDKLKTVIGFDENAYSYNKNHYLETYAIRKQMKRDAPLYEDILRTRLMCEGR